MIRRYTELPYVLQLLQSRRLTLVNPSAWDDKNDSHFLEVYRDRMQLGSVLALCLTSATQTYHHWKVFTHGASGACIFFREESMNEWIDATRNIVGREVEYRTLRQVQRNPPRLEDLPFTKRIAYEHEREFRLLYTSDRRQVSHRSFPIPVELVASVLLNPWLPAATATAVESVIHQIPGFEELPVNRATITKNDEWQEAAARAEA